MKTEPMCCPECGQEDAFVVEARCCVTVAPPTPPLDARQFYWTDRDTVRCMRCDHRGTVREFSDAATR